MVLNLTLGTLCIAATVIFHTVGLMALTTIVNRLVRRFHLHVHVIGKTMSMVATVLGIFVLHTVEIWFWAAIYFADKQFGNFPDALYFSTVTFSTLGYGDIILTPEWRLLGALEAINGFILLGWSTAYLVAASTRHGPFRLGEHF
jgi:voltage-gated potassium channel Kch